MEDSKNYVMGGSYKTPLLSRFSLSAGVPAGTYPIEVIDVSYWQGVIDMPVMASKANALIIRSSFGNDGIDLKAVENASKAEAAGLPWGIYHYVDGKDHKKHVETFKNSYQNIGGQLPPIWDLEYNTSDSKIEVGNWLEKLLNLWLDKTGVKPMIYTRKSWFDSHTYMMDGYKHLLLHVAHYTNAEQPLIPNNWEDINNPNEPLWELWQWSADGNGKGAEYGVQSKSVDRNRFNGTATRFKEVFGVEPHIPSSPPIPPPSPTECIQFTNQHVLNIRSGPGTNFADIGDLPAGSIVSVNDVAGSESWIEIEKGKWVAVFHNNVRLLKKVV